MREMEETQNNVFRTLEEMPTQTYIGLALASVLVSAFFFLIGRRSTSLFIGQWAPTFGIFALMYKLLHPSHERPIEEMGEAMSRASRRMSK